MAFVTFTFCSGEQVGRFGVMTSVSAPRRRRRLGALPILGDCGGVRAIRRRLGRGASGSSSVVILMLPVK